MILRQKKTLTRPFLACPKGFQEAFDASNARGRDASACAPSLALKHHRLTWRIPTALNDSSYLTFPGSSMNPIPMLLVEPTDGMVWEQHTKTWPIGIVWEQHTKTLPISTLLLIVPSYHHSKAEEKEFSTEARPPELRLQVLLSPPPHSFCYRLCRRNSRTTFSVTGSSPRAKRKQTYHPTVGVAVVWLRQKVPGRLSSSCMWGTAGQWSNSTSTFYFWTK